MSKRLYVGNIPWGATEEDLSNHFESCGDVLSATIVKDRETGRSRGFGFVEMEDEGAQKAMNDLNEVQFNGRPLKVNEAREREKRSFDRR